MKALAERVAPASAEAVGEIVGACDRAGEKVSIVGGNTLEGMTLPPERVDLTLDVTALRGVVANERADLTLAVRAGTPLQDVATLLAAQGMFVPFDAPQPLYATVGGTLAAGWAGPRRHLYGRIRDYLIGSTVVLADGTIARAGGMVVKNVAGYDMSRFYVGSFGTLGILVQANFKTIPMPPHARCFLAPLPERTRERAAVQLAGLSIRPSAAFIVRGFENAVDGEDGDEGRRLCPDRGQRRVARTLDAGDPFGARARRRARDARDRRRGACIVRARRRRLRRLLGRALRHLWNHGTCRRCRTLRPRNRSTRTPPRTCARRASST